MMNHTQDTTPRIVQLSDRILSDIDARGLQPSDPYFGTAEAARMLGVSTSAANRAMQLLVKRGVLERRQRRGTFIAATPQPSHNGDGNGDGMPPISRVHLLVHRDYLKTEGLLTDGVLVGVQEILPMAQIQFNFLPIWDAEDYVKRVIDTAAGHPDPEGFILIRSPLSAQRQLEESGLPTVIHGTPYSSITRLPWIDRDHRSVGRQLSDRLLAAGCRRLAVLLRDRISPGDHDFLDGIQSSAAAAGLGPAELVFRCLPADERVTAAELRRLFSGHEGRLGVLCRSEPLGQGVLSAAAEDEISLERDIKVAVSDVYGAPSRKLPFLHARPTDPPERIGTMLGRMLIQVVRGESPAPIQTSCTLVEP